MDKEKRIKALLEKFYEGGTDPTEYSELKEYFAGADEISPELAADRELFNAFGAETEIPEGLEEKLRGAITAAEKGRRKIWRRYLAAGITSAAAVTLILTFGLRFIPDAGPEIPDSPKPTLLLAKADMQPDAPAALGESEQNQTLPVEKPKSVNPRKQMTEDPTDALLAGEASLRLLSDALNRALLSASDNRMKEQINEQFENIDKTLNAVLK